MSRKSNLAAVIEMMTNAELAAALRRIAPETGSLVCLGCGHEHNCGIHGCALLREAAERIDTRQSAYFVHDGPRFRGGVDWWHCSNCGRLVTDAEHTQYDYCPWCGAKMDGDSDEKTD